VPITPIVCHNRFRKYRYLDVSIKGILCRKLYLLVDSYNIRERCIFSCSHRIHNKHMANLDNKHGLTDNYSCCGKGLYT